MKKKTIVITKKKKPTLILVKKKRPASKKNKFVLG